MHSLCCCHKISVALTVGACKSAEAHALPVLLSQAFCGVDCGSGVQHGLAHYHTNTKQLWHGALRMSFSLQCPVAQGILNTSRANIGDYSCQARQPEVE